MNISSRKRILSGPLALVMSLSALLSVICCGVFADTSAMAYTAPAGDPPAGLNCVASDGKIAGNGSTYQEALQQETWSAAYTQEFCGSVAEQPENTERHEKDPAGHSMVAYNYPTVKSESLTGSGNGNKASSCRFDDFTGTDIPYANAELPKFNGEPGELNHAACEEYVTKMTGKAPYAPLTPPWPLTEGAEKDHKAPIMSFPISGSSVSIPTHLTEETCGGHKPPTTINLTAEAVTRIFGGDYLHWNEVPGIPAECTGAISRVVRQDDSGTTNIFKSYLVRIDNSRTLGGAATCATEAGDTWEKYFTAKPNTLWPTSAEGGTCSPVLHGPKSGNLEVLAKLKETPGGIAYVDLPQAINQGLVLASVRNAVNTSYQKPNVGTAANCNYGVLTLPGLTASEAVGLNPEDNWSNNNEKPKSEGGNGKAQHGIATDLGAKYPICGLTWDMVYTHDESSSNPEVAIGRMTADQRRTLYSYFTFILSSAGQDLTNEVYYAPLPTSWLSTLREGFQQNF